MDAVKYIKERNRHTNKTGTFCEKFPDAKKDEFGDPLVCRKRIYKSKCVCSLSCHACWNESIEGGD